MRVTFWGTRGSLAKPGPSTIRYGGNTSCVQIESSSGTLVLLDCGTGAHGLGQQLLGREEQPLRGHILISHTHWDHIQGLPFFTPLFVPGNEWDIYGPRGLGEGLRDTLSGQMRYTYFPVTLDALGAEVRYHNLVEGGFDVGDIRVRTRYLNHPALTLGYRLEVDGLVVVYVCDHEPHARELATSAGEITGQDREHAEFLRGADLVIHDAQYTVAEYPDKVGWGHGTGDYAVRVCRSVGVQRLALTHHDPMRSDDALDEMVESLHADLDDDGPGLEVFAAAEGQVVELTPAQPRREASQLPEEEALSVAAAPEGIEVLLGMEDSPEAELILGAAAADGMDVSRAAGPAGVVDRFDATRPALVVMEGDDAGLDACHSLRAQGDERSREVPVILVGPEIRADECVTDWLVTPFSAEYARSRMRAWMFRVECRWQRAPFPREELDRLSTLHDLDLLDTEAEERFDRITRIAISLFDVPSSWVTLMDADRQWFKSRVGVEASETPRDQSFCSHAILDAEPLIVPDALLDDRFADSPLVTGPPHVRFYAGCPVSVDGFRVGTLCISDVRARHFTDEQIGLLKDLAAMVETELVAGG